MGQAHDGGVCAPFYVTLLHVQRIKYDDHDLFYEDVWANLSRPGV